MKREQFLRELRDLARKTNVEMVVIENRGKGSHYRVKFNGKTTTVQSGDLTPTQVRRLKKQLGID